MRQEKDKLTADRCLRQPDIENPEGEKKFSHFLRRTTRGINEYCSYRRHTFSCCQIIFTSWWSICTSLLETCTKGKGKFAIVRINFADWSGLYFSTCCCSLETSFPFKNNKCSALWIPTSLCWCDFSAACRRAFTAYRFSCSFFYFLSLSLSLSFCRATSRALLFIHEISITTF